MITICPQCQLSLAVSASDLRIAHGQVRCGRCASVFNALISLYETESEASVPAADPAADPAPPVTELSDEQAAATDTSDTRFFEVVIKSTGADPVANTGVFVAETAAQDAPQTPDIPDGIAAELPIADISMADISMADIAIAEAPTDAASQEQVEPVSLDEPVASAEAEGIDLAEDIGIPDAPEIPDIAANDPEVDVPMAANDPRIDDVAAANDPVALPDAAHEAAAAPQDSDWHVVPQLEPAPDADQQGTAWLPVYDLSDEQPEPAAAAAAARGAAVDIDVGEAISTIPRDEPQVVADEPRDDIDTLEDEPQRDRRWWAFAAGAGVLALTLAAQLVHFNRDALATWPSISTPLSRFYASIGLPIALRGDLRAYDVRQLGAFAAPDAAGTLTVRASLRNLAPRAQPMPLLRVTLQDRYGNRIASRDLAAAEYQQRPAGTSPWPLIASGARLDTAVQLVDPGGKAVGFELDVCLAGPGGVVRCANDEPARAAR